jgi:sec-independent protein translocase protein TatC
VETEAPTGGEQPLMAHLLELRKRLVLAIIGVVVVLVPMAVYSRHIYALVAQPLLRLMPKDTHMVATEVASPFLTPFKLSAIMSIFVAMPWILYQVWAFVAPGLYKHERKFMVPLLATSTLLFYTGTAFAYFLVLPAVFKFFLGVVPEGVEVMTDITKYLDFVMKIFLAFGLAFETPVAIVLLVWSGIVTPQQLTQRREYVIVGCFVVAMFITPPDVLSQTMVAVPAYLLYEVGILWARWLIKAKLQRQAMQPNEITQPPS